MSVLCKDKTAAFEEVLRSILTDDGLQENKYLTEFEKYDLLSAFWQQADVAFGYNDPKPTLENSLLRCLLLMRLRVFIRICRRLGNHLFPINPVISLHLWIT